MNILIVDDERFQHDELQSTIEAVRPGNAYAFACNYDEAMEQFERQEADVAFIDVSMPGKSGLELAKELVRRKPNLNVVMVTAYREYALDALRMFVSGYVLKPAREVEIAQVLDNLRNPVVEYDSKCSARASDGAAEQDGHGKGSGNVSAKHEGGAHNQSEESVMSDVADKRLTITCFGTFEVFGSDGLPLKFRRQKEKELLAYLVCLNGSSATSGQVCACLFEWGGDYRKNASYFRHIVSALKSTLRKTGYADVLSHTKNAYAINTSMVNCDYYDYLAGKPVSYLGEFMYQYSWAEQFKYNLDML